jgi:uncharacterized protein
MHAVLPERIDPARLADKGARLQGRVALESMERLVPLLAGEPGEAEVEEVLLTCQRCLQPVATQVDGEFHLAVVVSPTEERRLPEGLEPLDCGEGPVPVAQLVEDEILLGLPLVPSHPDSGCSRETARWKDQADAATDNPFSVLKDWQDKRRQE